MSGPLEGVRVIDLGRVASAPFGALILGDLGAEVIKIEDVNGSFDRQIGQPSRNGVEAFFINTNRGKKSIALDLRSPEGREAALTLIADSDAVVANFRPGVLTAMGLDYEAIHARNPRVVVAEITGFGESGPYRDMPAFDPVIQGLAGMIALQRPAAGGPPDVIHNMIVDKITSLFAANAISAALYVRERTGLGQRLEIPMLDSAVYFLWPEGMADQTFVGDFEAGRMGVKTLRLTEVADGFVVYMAIALKQRLGLLDAVNRSDLRTDPRFATQSEMIKRENLDALETIVREEALKFPKEDFIKRMNDAGVPCGPVLETSQVVRNEHVEQVGLLRQWTHPVGGEVRSPRPPVRFSDTPADPTLELRPLGGDGPDLLRGSGYSEERIAELIEAGVLNPGEPR
ncbi:CoA transferase [Streptosporangium sp. NPDC049304]|uniref:CaiB/BaiF CoA transferase family protein n=1 Tax=Streptosporangium sp. NPDC049304 TaxID=3154830 RepID=UPI003426B3D4